MIYLLAKYTLLFLLAAVLGFMLGYWFSRRNMEDVSESFEDLRRANSRSDDANWDRLWSQLKAIPEPKETDLSDLYARLDGVTNAVAQIPEPKSVDIQPVVDNLYKIESDIKAIPVPEKPAAIDFAPVMGKIEALQAAVRGIPPVELPDPVDLVPVTTQLNLLEQRVKSIPQAPRVDLGPVDRRLKAIEAEIGILGKRLPRQESRERMTRDVSRDMSRKTSQDEPRILRAALYGNKDNLQLISGIGPKLENLLNKNGIFYFWQVAEWNNRDIHIMDERLDAFKGRIGRDNWVEQAGQLRRDPSAASMPADI
ncbi:MAG: hypothetical protein GY949_07010 [Gammaproteobacteria bacterium]|nr:hypothetical protein [Gammaproteobacteria bacterium]